MGQASHRSIAPATDPPPTDEALGRELRARLDHLEREIYRTLSVRSEVEEIASRARMSGLHCERLRADLLVADIDSRSGNSQAALVAQSLLKAEATELGLHDLVRRANAYLASTHDRLGHRRRTMTCAQEALQWTGRPGDEAPDPPAWRAEALMVLTLLSMTRSGADAEMMSRAREAVRDHCGPILLAATEANFAEVAGEINRPDVAGEMAHAAMDTLARHPDAEAALTWESIARGLDSSGDLPGAITAIDRALEIEPLLGSSDTNGDPWLTAAELFDRQGLAERGLVALDAPRRPRHTSVRTRMRELKVRSQLLAGLGRWHEAYGALLDHVELYEQMRTVEVDQYVEQVQSRVAVNEERERARLFEQLALTDPLTGLPNRRGVDQWLNEVRLVEGSGLGVAIVDADHFKTINDRFSHDAGDQVLRLVALTLSDSLAARAPGGHLVGRLGGEEFVMAWPARTVEEVVATADSIREGVESTSMVDIAAGLSVTVSVGCTLVVDYSELEGTPRPGLVRADTALYAAKAAGRNAVRAG